MKRRGFLGLLGLGAIGSVFGLPKRENPWADRIVGQDPCKPGSERTAVTMCMPYVAEKPHVVVYHNSCYDAGVVDDYFRRHREELAREMGRAMDRSFDES